MVRLKVISGPAAGQSFELEREIVVGREGADVTIADPELSRRHAAIRPVEGGVEVEDLDSLNGTSIEGQRLSGTRLLTASTRLKLGTSELELELVGPTRESPIADPATTRPRDVPVAAPAVTRERAAPVAEPAVTRERAAPVAEPAVTRERAAPVAGPAVTRARERPSPAPGPPTGGPALAEPARGLGDQAEERELARNALILAIGSAVLGIIGALLHPQPDPEDTNVVAFLETITDSSSAFWIVLHMVGLASLFLGAFAFFLLYRSLAKGRGAFLAQVGVVTVMIATAVATVWLVLDGVAMKAIADDWAASTGAEHIADERAAVAIEHFILAMFSMFVATWLGFPFLFFGLALTRDGRFAAWLGVTGVVLGVLCIVVGFAQFGTERDALVTHILIPLLSTLTGIWVLALFIIWWRQVKGADVPRRAEGSLAT
jgi:pSer/pThr/pTyr-binding forkhead associated (FHA) protein